MRWLNPKRFYGFVLYDHVRPVELFSALNLLAWSKVLITDPLVLARDSYQTFQSLPATVWAAIFSAAALLQMTGIFLRHAHTNEVRFIGMALAAGCWAAITVNFVASDVSTTAPANYALLTLMTAISGGFLGWKTSFPIS
uniref:hypothetical protein n=1 Tax=Yoonia sp. TaxID=2212373 RepID=UPI004048C4CE